MCYSSHFKDTLTLENQPFFKRMEILIFDTHQSLSDIIFPFQFTKCHSSEGCLFTSEKTCDVYGVSEANRTKWTKFQKSSHLTLMDFAEILSSQCTHQGTKILKILLSIGERFQNYSHINYGPFSLDIESLQFMAF